jgi:hypothetical protein
MAGNRNFVILGVGPNEFLVRADDTHEALNGALQKMLADVPFELQPLTDKQAAEMERRLSPPQIDMLKGVSKKVRVSLKKRDTSHFVVRLSGDRRLTASASPKGVVKFNPVVERVRKPLPGGVGPVGVTVGVGIAGKF